MDFFNFPSTIHHRGSVSKYKAFGLFLVQDMVSFWHRNIHKYQILILKNWQKCKEVNDLVTCFLNNYTENNYIIK